MKRQVSCEGLRMRVAGEMTVYTAAALYDEVLAAIDTHAQTNMLDLSEVTEIDTAGLQILLVACRRARELGRELQIVAVSLAVNEVLELVQLATLTHAHAIEAGK
jgi:anti-sigma B factor antagonist